MFFHRWMDDHDFSPMGPCSGAGGDWSMPHESDDMIYIRSESYSLSHLPIYGFSSNSAERCWKTSILQGDTMGHPGTPRLRWGLHWLHPSHAFQLHCLTIFRLTTGLVGIFPDPFLFKKSLLFASTPMLKKLDSSSWWPKSHVWVNYPSIHRSLQTYLKGGLSRPPPGVPKGFSKGSPRDPLASRWRASASSPSLSRVTHSVALGDGLGRSLFFKENLGRTGESKL